MARRLTSLACVAWLLLVAGAMTRAAPGAPAGVARQSASSGDVWRASAQGRTPAPPARYNLLVDERRGGHTLARHVGRSEADLRERLRRERTISAASTYPDRETAERVVAITLQRERFRIQDWIRAATRHPNLALDYRSDRPIGISLGRGRSSPEPCYDAVVVLKWDAGRHDYYVLTSYPEARR
jgi:hypothetical protein